MSAKTFTCGQRGCTFSADEAPALCPICNHPFLVGAPSSPNAAPDGTGSQASDDQGSGEGHPDHVPNTVSGDYPIPAAGASETAGTGAGALAAPTVPSPGPVARAVGAIKEFLTG